MASEPATLHANGSATWTRTVSDYTADDGYDLEYVFFNSETQFRVNGGMVSGSGDVYTVTITPSGSAAWQAGTYSWQAYATKSGERWPVASGVVEVLPDLVAAGKYDNRSHVKKMLDELKARLEGRATKEYDSVSIRGRSLSLMSIAELRAARDLYAREYEAELAAERIADGKTPNSVIRVRFD